MCWLHTQALQARSTSCRMNEIDRRNEATPTSFDLNPLRTEICNVMQDLLVAKETQKSIARRFESKK